MPGLLYVDDLVLYGEEDLKVMMGGFAEVCKRRGSEVNADKSKVEGRYWGVRFLWLGRDCGKCQSSNI